jgi:hypothetical protein
MPEGRSFSVIYNSGVSIWDPSHLSTLSVFYDKVWLPHMDNDSMGTLAIFARKLGSSDPFRFSVAELANWRIMFKDGTHESSGEFVRRWEFDNRILFSEGVLERLESPAQRVSEELLLKLDKLELDRALLDIPLLPADRAERIAIPLLAGRGELVERVFLWQDHLEHLTRTDVSGEAVFLTREADAKREKYKSLMAHSVFTYLLPRLGELSPEQILEVREEIKANREGFAMYLQSLSAEVEKRVIEGEPLKDTASYARSVVETQLIPGYSEFRRQLAAKRAGFWKRVLDVSGKIFEIDSTPWTPKFYGALMKAIGFTILTGAEEQEDGLSNKTQAYHFMKSLDKHF